MRSAILRNHLNSGYVLSQQSNFICKTMTLNSKLIIVYSFLFIIHGICTSGKNLDFEDIEIHDQWDNTVALGKKIVRVSVWASCKINFFLSYLSRQSKTAALIFPALFSAVHPYCPASSRVTLSMVRVLFLTI